MLFSLMRGLKEEDGPRGSSLYCESRFIENCGCHARAGDRASKCNTRGRENFERINSPFEVDLKNELAHACQSTFY